MGIKYWYKSQIEGSSFTEITKSIGKKASGEISINNIPGQFSLTIEPYQVGSRNPTGIDINTGDEILITLELNGEISVIAYGAVFDPGRTLLSFDRVNSIAIVRFEVKCFEEDFSSYPIDSLTYTDTLISNILDEIMLYTTEDLNNTTVGKYKINIDDYNISYSVEKKTAREALTDLCEQIECFWCLKYSIVADAVTTWKIYRYLEISTKSGITPPTTSTWYTGLQNINLYSGTIENPIIENQNKIPRLLAEINFKTETDPSVIINYLDLNCKVFDNNNINIYSKYETPALPGRFDYQLDSYADDIKYIAISVKTNVLPGSTSTVVKIPSNKAANGIINTGDKVRFEDYLDSYEETSFFEVQSVNVIDIYTTEITFDTLPFTPATGSKFEVISNVSIYRDESLVNYASKGALINCDKKTYVKIKFLPLSEPPSGQIISFIYTKVVDYRSPIKNDESINTRGIGLKYKEIKLDDSITLTREEIQNLTPKLLTLKPQNKLTIDSFRYGFIDIGLSISVNINNLLTDNLIVNSNSWKDLGTLDANKIPLFQQTINLSNLINQPDKILARLNKSKKQTSTSAASDGKNIQHELIKVQEFINWSFNALQPSQTPTSFTALAATNYASNSFTANWTNYQGAITYYVDVSNDNFTTKLFTRDLTIVGTGNKSLSIDTTGYTGPFYYRVKALINYQVVAVSNIISVDDSIPFQINSCVFDVVYFVFYAGISSNYAGSVIVEVNTTSDPDNFIPYGTLFLIDNATSMNPVLAVGDNSKTLKSNLGGDFFDTLIRMKKVSDGTYSNVFKVGQYRTPTAISFGTIIYSSGSLYLHVNSGDKQICLLTITETTGNTVIKNVAIRMDPGDNYFPYYIGIYSQIKIRVTRSDYIYIETTV